MKFEVYNKEPDFIRQQVKKGMFGIQFVAEPFLQQRVDDYGEYE